MEDCQGVTPRMSGKSAMYGDYCKDSMIGKDVIA
jgi:hypothetical protein